MTKIGRRGNMSCCILLKLAVTFLIKTYPVREQVKIPTFKRLAWISTNLKIVTYKPKEIGLLKWTLMEDSVAQRWQDRGLKEGRDKCVYLALPFIIWEEASDSKSPIRRAKTKWVWQGPHSAGLLIRIIYSSKSLSATDRWVILFKYINFK